MSLKLCFNNEIHRVSKLPVSISALTNFVQTIYGNALPSNWGLQYVDSEGDRIVLKSDEDLKILLGEVKSGRSSKIFITDSGIFDSKSYSDESYQVIQKEDAIQVEHVIQEKIIPQVSNTEGDKTEVKQPENKEKPWEKFKNCPKFKALRIIKRLREEGLSEPEKLKNEEALAKIKATLNEEELAWLEKKSTCEKKERRFHCKRGEKGEGCKWKERREKSEKTEKGEKSERRHHHHKREGPFADAKRLLKQLILEKDVPETELAELQKKYDEIFATLTESEKDKLTEKKAHYEHKREKKTAKQGKLASAFTKFLKENAEDLISVTGHPREKGRCGPMKKLVEELCQTFIALPEEKQAEVGTLLQGIPQKMIEMTKAKHEKKEKRRLEKENKDVETVHPKEEEKSQEPEKKVDEKKEKKEKRDKSEKKDKKAKTPEKKPDEKKAEEGTTSGSDQEVPKKVRPMIKTKVQMMKEIFPEADAKVLREFITKQVSLTIEQLIDQYLALSK